MREAEAIRDEAIALREDNIQAMTVAFLRFPHCELAFQLAQSFYTVVDLDREVILFREKKERKQLAAEAFRQSVFMQANFNNSHRVQRSPPPTGTRYWNQQRKKQNAAQKIAHARAAVG